MKTWIRQVVRALLGLTFLCGGSVAPAAGVQTIAYEGFDYLEGGVVAGAATGFGWTNAWGESGDSGDDHSELIIGPGSFPVPSGFPAATGNHADLNHQTGHRRITRRMAQTLGGGLEQTEHTFSFVLDCGPGGGVDYAGVELSHSAGGPVVFIGKPPGAGPGDPGEIGMDVYGQGFTGTGVGATGQKLLLLRWSPNESGPDEVTLVVFDVSGSGALGGTTSQAFEASFDHVTLVARRDLAFGGAIPAFDEIRATTGDIQTNLLTVASLHPSEGVQIQVSPDDLNGAGSGSTLFERSYPVGEPVVLTAPANAGGNSFLKWTLDGADFSTRRTITVGMTEEHEVTAVFKSSAKTLSVSSAGVAAPVTIGVSPQDQASLGGGTAPFTRSYADGTVVSLSAPPTVSDASFERWMVNGAEVSADPSLQVVMSGDIDATAVYDYPHDESITGVTVDANQARVTWSAVGGRSYVVEASEDLVEFEPVGDTVHAEGLGRTDCELIEPLDPRPPRRFYRVRIGD